MKSPLIIPSVLTLALHLSLSLSAQEMEIFNGKDLTGWRGLPAVWAVQDGAITGRAAENRENTFLIWEGGTVKDFEFSCEYKLTANNPEKIANSGIQFRAHIVDNAGLKLTGYQAEMDNGAQRPKRWPVMKNTNGSVIEDAPGKLLAPAGQRTVAQNGNVPDNPMMGIYTTTGTTTSQEVLDRVYLKGGWNSLRIIAHGNRIQTYINGLPAAECVDSAYRYQSGHLGLQYHGRGAKTVQFKNLKLTHLRDAPLVAQTPDVSPAPSSSPAPTASPSPSRATDTLPPLKACLLDYMWEWNSPLGKTLAAFQPDGALILKDKRALKWSMTGSQTIQVTGDSGKAVELVFDTTFSTFKMSSAAGSNESSQIWGTRSPTLPPRLESVITTRAWAWRQVWAPPSKRWSEVRFDRDGTFRAFHGTSLAYTGKWELAGPGRIKIPNNKIPFISTFGYFLQFDNELTRFEATDLGKRKVPGENIGPASQAPLPLPPPKPEDEFRTAFAMVGGGSNGGTNFGFGDTKRTLDVSINTASDDHIHVTVKASWVVLTPGRQLVPSRTETRKFTIGGDHPYYEKFSITSVWQRTNGVTDGITNEDGVLRGWVVRAYDVNGKEISAAASLPAYLGIGK